MGSRSLLREQGEALSVLVLVGAPCRYSGPRCGKSFDRLVDVGFREAVDLVLEQVCDEVGTVLVAGGRSK